MTGDHHAHLYPAFPKGRTRCQVCRRPVQSWWRYYRSRAITKLVYTFPKTSSAIFGWQAARWRARRQP